MCIVPGLLLLECKCKTFYCEINKDNHPPLPTLLDNLFFPSWIEVKFKEQQRIFEGTHWK